MNLSEFNSLTDLFFYQAKKQKSNDIFLEWLNTINRKKFTWSETISCVYKFAAIIKKNIHEGDRCLLVSENRPEWLIADLSIMLANGITVPAYTTYTENDYKYLIEDCLPSIVIVSNSKLHKKLEKIIEEKKFIKKVITFDNIAEANDQNKYIDFDSIVKEDLLDSDKIKNLNIKRKLVFC